MCGQATSDSKQGMKSPHLVQDYLVLSHGAWFGLAPPMIPHKLAIETLKVTHVTLSIEIQNSQKNILEASLENLMGNYLEALSNLNLIFNKIISQV